MRAIFFDEWERRCLLSQIRYLRDGVQSVSVEALNDVKVCRLVVSSFLVSPLFINRAYTVMRLRGVDYGNKVAELAHELGGNFRMAAGSVLILWQTYR